MHTLMLSSLSLLISSCSFFKIFRGAIIRGSDCLNTRDVRRQKVISSIKVLFQLLVLIKEIETYGFNFLFSGSFPFGENILQFVLGSFLHVWKLFEQFLIKILKKKAGWFFTMFDFSCKNLKPQSLTDRVLKTYGGVIDLLPCFASFLFDSFAEITSLFAQFLTPRFLCRFRRLNDRIQFCQINIKQVADFVLKVPAQSSREKLTNLFSKLVRNFLSSYGFGNLIFVKLYLHHKWVFPIKNLSSSFSETKLITYTFIILSIGRNRH